MELKDNDYIFGELKGRKILNKNYLLDDRLSLIEKGLLTLLLSLPDGYEYTREKIGYMNNLTNEEVDKAFDELEKAGYIEYIEVVK